MQRLSLIAIFVLTAAVNDSIAAETKQPTADFSKIQPVLENYCYGCHGHGADEGGVVLDTLHENPEAAQKTWVAVLKNMRSQTMPPADQDQPTIEERELVGKWIQTNIFKLDPKNPDPGRVTIRRLNRDEYRYTIEDLFGYRYKVDENFPPDDTGYGFDTIGDVLSMSPLMTEKYFDAAQEIVREVVPTQDKNSTMYKRVFFDGPPPEGEKEREEYARKILKHFSSKAFRRPVPDETLDRLVAIQKQISSLPDRSFEQGISQAFAAMLISPQFLYRAEIQPEPNNPGKVVNVDEYALASRLSYFLWSSLPDYELTKLASEGKLRENLHAQVDRMLDNPKSQRFIQRFVGQWLQAQDVEGLSIDPRRALELRDLGDAQRIFSRTVRQSMRQETEMLFEYILKENRSAGELLTANYTFLNEPLAKFYGLEDIKDLDKNRLKKVDLPEDSKRGGILTQGTFLVVTSNPTRTSPVKRGLFILDNILGSPPPPAPPNVPALEAVRQRGQKLTMREQMQLHASEGLCKSCHARMDPLGLSLEKFTYIGQFQEEDDGQPIETAGKLITGEEFASVKELSQVLANERKIDFYRCLTEKLLTYALGRGLEYYDTPSIDIIVDEMLANDGKLRDTIHTLIDSAPFQKRRGDGDLLSSAN
ncbi:hypothetical protein C5Y96_03710 [Blastopirellula marina]|uniref:Cytochrome c domain-containing protein n=1 Tax=Blastopirellula marina TaxID=124 RepID=A0A2S8G3G1_9BACT|nr:MULTISPECIES: DUF1592 domain-containing protein [Pirellulaceae]PQO38988.1 hypothetical protein C5Y96_03710 [Blastopirellula marina]RCS55296.1 DUF1592 domain-containing protein [Bremerella cremea]